MRSHCLCQQPSAFKNLFRTRNLYDREYFDVAECPYCMIRLVTNPPQSLEKYYINTPMRKKQNSFYILLKNILLRKELRRIQKMVPQDITYLDIGCGGGEFSRLIHTAKCKVIAIDSIPQKPYALEALEHIPYHTINFDDGVIDQLDKKTQGVVILRHVLEHVMDPNKFIQQLHSYHNDYFYIVVPNHATAGDKLFKQYYSYYDVPRHLWFFTPDSIKRLFNSLDFEIIDQGFDTIPTLISCLYRTLYLNNFPKSFCEIFHPQRIISTISLPLDFLMPNNVLWVLAKKKGAK